MNRGDLVRDVKDGYHGIVLFEEGGDVGVFWGNGLAEVVQDKSRLEMVPLKPGSSSPSNFGEILGSAGFAKRSTSLSAISKVETG